MSAYNLTIDNEHLKIIKQYKILFSYFFNYSLYVILLIFATLIFIYLFQNQSKFQPTEANVQFSTIKHIDLKDRFEKFMNRKVDYPDIEIKIPQGPIFTSGSYIESLDNFMLFKGFIVPRYFQPDDPDRVMEMSQMQSNDYDPQVMELFVRNIVFNITPNNIRPAFKREQLPLFQNKILSTFSLSCVMKPQFLQTTCDFYIQQFLENFYIYQIDKDYAGLKKVADRLVNTSKYKTDFCKKMKYYVLYSNDTNLALNPIFASCSVSDLNYFKLMQDFIEIQPQLKQGWTSDTVYTDAEINAYKLLSIQQILYSKLSRNTVHDALIRSYIEFTQKLLKENRLAPFYKDEMYRFNNYYLKKKLEAMPQKTNKAINQYLHDIFILNKGSSLIGFVGLDEQVSNKKLLLKKETFSTTTKQYSIRDMLGQIENLSFFVVTETQITDKNATIQGYLSVPYNGTTLKVYTVVQVSIKDGFLVVDQITFPQYIKLSDSLNETLKKTNMTFTKTYYTLLSIFDLYIENTKELNLCTRIKEIISNAYINRCTDSYLTVDKIHNKQKIEYKFTRDKNYNLKSVFVSDPKYAKLLKESLSKQSTDLFTLPNRIYNLLDLEVKEENQSPEIKNNLLIIETFQKMLGITPYDIKNIDGKFWVSFYLSQIGFTAEYDIRTNTIKNMYFTNVYYKKDKNLEIKQFVLSLTENNKDKINKFVLDPLMYIKSINKKTYTDYLKYK